MRGSEELRNGPFDGLDISHEATMQGMVTMLAFLRSRVGAEAPLPVAATQIQNLLSLQHKWAVSVAPSDHPLVVRYRETHRLSADQDVRWMDFVLEVAQQKRGFCHLFSLEVALSVSDDGEIAMRVPGTEARLPIPGQRAVREDLPTRGRLHGVVSSTGFPWHLFCFLYELDDADRLLAAWRHGEPHDPDEVASIMATLQMERALQDHAQIELRALSAYVARSEQARDLIAQEADRATGWIAQELQALLAQSGLRNAEHCEFGVGSIVANLQELRCLAMAGLAAALKRSSAGIAELMRSAGYEWEDAQSIARRVEDESGVRLIAVDGDRVRVMV